MNTKIGTLNLCLGLKNKKEEVKQLIIKNNIDILCIQETELERDYPVEILTFKGYGLEMEKKHYQIEIRNLHKRLYKLYKKNRP